MLYLPYILILLPMASAFALRPAAAQGRARAAWVMGAMIVELALSIALLFSDIRLSVLGVMGEGLNFQTGSVQAVLGVMASFAGLCALSIMWEGEAYRRRYAVCVLLTLGAVQGVFLAADVHTAFVFFEMISFTSYVLIKQEETPQAIDAGRLYLAVSVGAGMISLLGLFLLYTVAGTLSFDGLAAYAAASGGASGAVYLAGALTLVGFAAKAALYPLHIWVAKSYAAAPASGGALLSGVLSKTGAFGALALCARLFPGDVAWNTTLMALGALTMIWGGLMAAFSGDLKRALGYSAMSQGGLIWMGVSVLGLAGENGAAAMAATALIALNHTLAALALFAIANVLYARVGGCELSQIQGFGRDKPLLKWSFALCALSLGGVPLTGGYVGMALLRESIGQCAGLAPEGWLRAADRVALLGGGLTLCYMARLFICVCVRRKAPEQMSEKTAVYMGPARALCMAVCALLCVAPGLVDAFADAVARKSAAFVASGAVDFAWYNAAGLTGAAIAIVAGAALYFITCRAQALRKSGAEGPTLEKLIYEPLTLRVLCPLLGAIARVFNGAAGCLLHLMKKYVFNMDDDRTPPPENKYFAVYPEEPYLRRGFTDTLAFSFLLFGIGLVAVLIYLLI